MVLDPPGLGHVFGQVSFLCLRFSGLRKQKDTSFSRGEVSTIWLVAQMVLVLGPPRCARVVSFVVALGL